VKREAIGMARYDSSAMHEEPVSKTKRKNEMLELQTLGATLLALPDSQLAEIELPHALVAALREARRISSREGKRRQLQYIGRLMREVDAEAVRAALAAIAGSSAVARARHRRLEQWRVRLLADDAALTEFAQTHAGADLQALRTLIRNARKEVAAARPPHAQRELFRLLRESIA
jgi:ribosome-associated protein